MNTHKFQPMRKWLKHFGALACTTVLSCVSLTAPFAEVPLLANATDTTIVGDMNNDQVVNVTDLALLKRAILKNDQTMPENGDFTADGVLNKDDVTIMQQFLLGFYDFQSTLIAVGQYNAEDERVTISWFTGAEASEFEVWISDDNRTFTKLAYVEDENSYTELLKNQTGHEYYKIVFADSHGHRIESNVVYTNPTENGIVCEYVDTDSDGLNDMLEQILHTNPQKVDTDSDGLTDYEEYALTNTNPLKEYSVLQGKLDADADPDGDGLTNRKEITLNTNCNAVDTDGDGLTDSEEVNVYFTDPLLPDTDGDTLGDNFEVLFSLDPLSETTNGVKDAEHQLEQELDATSPVFSTVNTSDAPYAVSATITSNGEAEQAFSISDSAYYTALKNDALIGGIYDISLSAPCNPLQTCLKFQIKEEYRDNTLNKYSEYEDMQGIQRLCIFQYFDEIGMLLPLETQYGLDTNTIYADVDENGTYCVMDMEIWYDLFDLEPDAVDQSEDKPTEALPGRSVARNDVPLDVVFMLQTAGKDRNLFEQELDLATEASEQIFFTYPNARIYVIQYTDATAYILSNGNRQFFSNVSALQRAIQSITFMESYWQRGFRYALGLLTNLPLRKNVNSFIYNLQSEEKFFYGGYNETNICASNLGIYSQFMPNDLYQNTTKSSAEQVKTAILNNNGINGVFSDTAAQEIMNHIAANLNYTLERTEYDTFDTSNLSEVTLKAKLVANSSVDSDGDGVSDWDEVNTKYLIFNGGGTFRIPTLGEVAAYAKNGKILGSSGNNSFGKIALLKELKKHGITVWKSDPTIVDSDGDGIGDVQDPKPNESFDKRFEIVDNANFVPSIDFVDERYANSQKCYCKYGSKHNFYVIGTELPGYIAALAAYTNDYSLADEIIRAIFGKGYETDFGPHNERKKDDYCMDHAADALMHYFNGTGEKFEYNENDTCEMISCSVSNLCHLHNNITCVMNCAEDCLNDKSSIILAAKSDSNLKAACNVDRGNNSGGLVCDVSGHFLHSAGVQYNYIHRDWWNTVGESGASIVAEISRSGNTYTMTYTYYFMDIYEWAQHYDPGLLNMTLHSYHEFGLAQEFLMEGKFNGTLTWQAGDDARQTDVVNQIKETLQSKQNSTRWDKSNEYDRLIEKFSNSL